MGIFISYRRADVPGQAGRLYDRLGAHFGGHDIFMDVEGIGPGEDFSERIDRVVFTCDALVALIGPDWLTASDARGRRRLDDPGDFVRLEIAAALRRRVLVIPVLVEGARMPSPADLPSALAPLARRQAIELSDARWRYDTDRLIAAIEAAPGIGAQPRPATAAAPSPRRRRTRLWAGGAALGAAMIAGVGLAVGGVFSGSRDASGFQTPAGTVCSSGARTLTCTRNGFTVSLGVYGEPRRGGLAAEGTFPLLEYGRVRRSGRFSCLVGPSSGTRCTNASRRSFVVNFQAAHPDAAHTIALGA